MSPPRYVDLLLLAAALAVFVLAGFPMLGYAVGAAAWLGQRGAQAIVARRSAEALAEGNRRGAMGLTAASALGRVWLMTLSVLLVGVLSTREDGLAAALLVTALFTVSFAAQGLAHLLEPEGQEVA